MLWLLLAAFCLIILFYFYKNEIEVKVIISKTPSKSTPRIGIVSDWHLKGVSYQSKFLSKCLSGKYDVFIFAYNEYIKDDRDWGYKKLVFTKVIKPKKVIDWIKKEGLKIVFFPDRLEDTEVLDWCRKNNVATIMIINYETIKRREIHLYKKYTKLLCPVRCTELLLKKLRLKNTKFIRWGIDNDIFYPKTKAIRTPIRYIHNAGYGGIEWRKNTLAAVEAFNIASRHNKDMKFILKTQKPIKEFPPRVAYLASKNRNIVVNNKNMKLNELIGLYRSCHVSILPSKWEGIGIPFIESLALGLPVITTDAPPMNEWVRHGYNGFCAKVREWLPRRDKQLLVEGAEADINDLTKFIIKFSDIKTLKKMRANAIKSSKDSKKNFTMEMNKFIRSL